MKHEEIKDIARRIDALKEKAGRLRDALTPVKWITPADLKNLPYIANVIELNGKKIIDGPTDSLAQAERSTLEAVTDLCRWKIRDIEKQIAELENSVVHYPSPRYKVGTDESSGCDASVTAVYDTKTKKIVALSEVDDNLDDNLDKAFGEAIKSVEKINSRIAAEGWPAFKRENMPKPEPQGGENPNEVRIPVLQRYMGKPSGTPGELAMKYVSQVLPPSGARGTLRRPTCDEMDLAKKHPRYKPYPGAGEPVLAVKWATKYDFTAPAEKRNTYFAVAWSNADGWWVSHNIAVSHGLVSKDGTEYLQLCPHGCFTRDRYNKYGVCESKHICMYDRIGPEQVVLQSTPAEQTMNELLSGTEWSDEEMKAVKEARDRELLRGAGIIDPEKLIPFIKSAGGIDKCAAVPDLTPEEKAALARLMDGDESPASIPPECSTDSGPLVETGAKAGPRPGAVVWIPRYAKWPDPPYTRIYKGDTQLRPPHDAPLPKSENVE